MATVREDSYAGIIEERVCDARFVDQPLANLKCLALNAPLTQPSADRFFALGAQIYADAELGRRELLGMLGKGCLAAFLGGFAAACESDYLRNRNVDNANELLNLKWKEELLGWDHVYGPGVFITPENNQPNDFENHLMLTSLRPPFGAVDYVAPIGMPLAMPKPGIASGSVGQLRGSLVLRFGHLDPDNPSGYNTWYAHLSGYSPNVDVKAKTFEQKINTSRLERDAVVAYSGITGTPWAHLHFGVAAVELNKERSTPDTKHWESVSPGIDPFLCGHGRRPIYHDGEANFFDKLDKYNAPYAFYNLRDNLAVDEKELGIDKNTKRKLKQFANEEDLSSLQNFLSHEVMKKHEGPNGDNYKYVPGTFMYGLALQFVRENKDQEILVTLPFISPYVVDRYKSANPGLIL